MERELARVSGTVSWAGLGPSLDLELQHSDLFKDPKSCLGSDGSSWTLPPGRKIDLRVALVLQTLNSYFI